jgi:hypothetical protein
MTLITKSDLQYEYSWTALPGDDPRISGEPDSTLLNRNEGYEMLYFINKFCEKYQLKKKSSAFKVERMIKIDMPRDIRSQENISKWVVENWANYDY